VKIFFNSWRDTAHPLAGGSELVVDRLAKELLSFGHEVTVAVPRPVEPHPYRVITTGSFFGQYVRSPYTAWRHARQADAVIDVANGIPHFTPLWRWRSPVVCWVHHVCDDQWSESFPPSVALLGRFLEAKVVPFVYRRAIFVAVSESTTEALERTGISRESISIINNGVDLPSPRAQASRSATPLFVCVARLVPNKRIHLLIDMWRTVSSQIDGHLIIIGDGPLYDQLKVDLPARCELLGRVSDAERDDWLRRAWLFLQTSSREGWGMSVIEAATHETPALAFDVPGSRDVIVDGETGVLAQDRAAFIDAWSSLAQDPSTRSKLGSAARQRAQSFLWESSAKRLEQLIFTKVLDRDSTMSVEELERNWNALGSRDPMWAILNDPRRRGNRWPQEQFFATGVESVEEVLEYVHSLDPSLKDGRALDFGCGIGRLTQALAVYFDRVDGIDIAPSMTERADQLNTHRDRCVYIHNSSGDLHLFPDASFDFILTELVLQHMPPKLMFEYLPEFTRILKPGGVAVFDVPRRLSWTPRAIGLRVLPASVIHWLRRQAHGDGVMELHTTSRSDVLAFLRSQPIEVLGDRPLQRFDLGVKRHQYCIRRLDAQVQDAEPNCSRVDARGRGSPEQA
jgi:glycosyltransferase involved in cell wall biosynthesis/SAM-dependent methyltransferase